MPTVQQFHHMMAIMKTIEKCNDTLRKLLQENQENDEVLEMIDKLMNMYATGVRTTAESVNTLLENKK
jgi:phosphoenolpyruvate carboxylase